MMLEEYHRLPTFSVFPRFYNYSKTHNLDPAVVIVLDGHIDLRLQHPRKLPPQPTRTLEA